MEKQLPAQRTQDRPSIRRKIYVRRNRVGAVLVSVQFRAGKMVFDKTYFADDLSDIDAFVHSIAADARGADEIFGECDVEMRYKDESSRDTQLFVEGSFDAIELFLFTRNGPYHLDLRKDLSRYRFEMDPYDPNANVPREWRKA